MHVFGTSGAFFRCLEGGVGYVSSAVSSILRVDGSTRSSEFQRHSQYGVVLTVASMASFGGGEHFKKRELQSYDTVVAMVEEEYDVVAGSALHRLDRLARNGFRG